MASSPPAPSTSGAASPSASPSCADIRDFKVHISHDTAHVSGRVGEPTADGKIAFLAASPPDRRQSFAGSALPFANPEQAYESTPTRGERVLTSAGAFDLAFPLPNAYYVGLGTVYVPPALHLWYQAANGGGRRAAALKLDAGVPYRMLTYPQWPTRPRDGPTFYTQAPNWPRTQEQILRDSGYPSQRAIEAGYSMPPNFWGLRPPL